MKLLFSISLLSASLLCSQDYTKDIASEKEEKPGSSFIDDEDGYFDIGSFLDKPYGFYPMVMPITEPAVGYGAAIVPVFIKRPEGQKRPNFYAAGAMKTENGTEGIFGGYAGYHFDEKLHLQSFIVSTSVNLDFHGLGSALIPGDKSLQYNLDLKGAQFGGNWQIADSPWKVGMHYFYGTVDASLNRASDINLLPPQLELPTLGMETTFSSIKTNVLYDTRDNIFTPTKGQYNELALSWNDTVLGASENFQILNFQTLQYKPLIKDTLYFALQAKAAHSFGDTPFYRQPFIGLRGAPAMRYQGEAVVEAEAELRWQVHPRWGILGFGGIGAVSNDFARWDSSETIATGGVGLRYLISRRHGMHAGIDLAFSEDSEAIYIQFGSAWMRP